MITPICQRAIDDCLIHRRALIKFISPNDAGATGSHQCGFYLPKNLWQYFTIQEPTRGINHKHEVQILWHDGRITESVVTWYGQKSRYEYRLTRFGKNFQFLTPDSVGDLLVLIPKSINQFLAYTFYREDDIDWLLATLDVNISGTWAFYNSDEEPEENEDECIDRCFRKFAAELNKLPSGKEFSLKTWDIIQSCKNDFKKLSIDKKLVFLRDMEYQLYQVVERKIYSPIITRLFKSIDDFLKTANSILQGRKSRAGRSLENHVELLFKENKIPFEMRQKEINGKPDLIIPGKKEYFDESYPLNKLFIMGIKTTCKDRWRQVLEEGKRVKKKHLLTMQKGISKNQLNEMSETGIILIVPEPLHKNYPSELNIPILKIDQFIDIVKREHSL